MRRLTDGDIHLGRDYLYNSDSSSGRPFTRAFRVTSLRSDQGADYIQLVEVSSIGVVGSPFPYEKRQFKVHFALQPEPVDPNITKVRLLLAQLKMSEGFKDILHERLIALEV